MTITTTIASTKIAPVIQFFLGLPRDGNVIEPCLIHDEEPLFLTKMRSKIGSLHLFGLDDVDIGRQIEADIINDLRDLDIDVSTTIVRFHEQIQLMTVVLSLFDEPTDEELNDMLSRLVEAGRQQTVEDADETPSPSFAAEQLAIAALNLSCSVEDAITEWQENDGMLQGDMVAELHSHKNRLDDWRRVYERLCIDERL